jgi:sulfate permease, SulP family
LPVLIKKMQSQGITFAVARVRDEVREQMQLSGIETTVGAENFYERVTDGVRAWQRRDDISPTVDGGGSTAAVRASVT